MSGAGLPPDPPALRAWLAAQPEATRAEALRGLLRAEAAAGPPGPTILSMVVWNPALLREAAEPLLAEPATRAHAGAVLTRLYSRLGAHDAVRALLRDRVREAEGAAWEERAELLRNELLAPSDEAEAIWRLATARLHPATRLGYAVQWAVARGEAPRWRELRDELAATVAQALAGDAPESLRRLAAARGIALVGNGGGLAGSGAAARIEAHDCVVRINYPPVAAFAADVGRRTDVMLIRHPWVAYWAECRAREPGHADLAALALHGRDGASPPGEAPCLPEALARLLVRITYRRATTGLRAILLLALALRRQVTLFGFDFFRPGTQGHYFDQGVAVAEHEPGYERWLVGRVLPVLCRERLRVDVTSQV